MKLMDRFFVGSELFSFKLFRDEKTIIALKRILDP